MCIFCAAVPATAALGAAANAKQKAAHESAATEPTEVGKTRVPVGKTTAVVIAGLVTASVVYHSQIGPA